MRGSQAIDRRRIDRQLNESKHANTSEYVSAHDRARNQHRRKRTVRSSPSMVMVCMYVALYTLYTTNDAAPIHNNEKASTTMPTTTLLHIEPFRTLMPDPKSSYEPIPLLLSSFFFSYSSLPVLHCAPSDQADDSKQANKQTSLIDRVVIDRSRSELTARNTHVPRRNKCTPVEIAIPSSSGPLRWTLPWLALASSCCLFVAFVTSPSLALSLSSPSGSASCPFRLLPSPCRRLPRFPLAPSRPIAMTRLLRLLLSATRSPSRNPRSRSVRCRWRLARCLPSSPSPRFRSARRFRPRSRSARRTFLSATLAPISSRATRAATRLRTT